MQSIQFIRCNSVFGRFTAQISLEQIYDLLFFYHYVSYFVVCVVYLCVKCVGGIIFIFIEINVYFLFMVFALQMLNIAEKYILKKISGYSHESVFATNI